MLTLCDNSNCIRNNVATIQSVHVYFLVKHQTKYSYMQHIVIMSHTILVLPPNVHISHDISSIKKVSAN